MIQFENGRLPDADGIVKRCHLQRTRFAAEWLPAIVVTTAGLVALRWVCQACLHAVPSHGLLTESTVSWRHAFSVAAALFVVVAGLVPALVAVCWAKWTARKRDSELCRTGCDLGAWALWQLGEEQISRLLPRGVRPLALLAAEAGGNTLLEQGLLCAGLISIAASLTVLAVVVGVTVAVDGPTQIRFAVPVAAGLTALLLLTKLKLRRRLATTNLLAGGAVMGLFLIVYTLQRSSRTAVPGAVSPLFWLCLAFGIGVFIAGEVATGWLALPWSLLALRFRHKVRLPVLPRSYLRDQWSLLLLSDAGLHVIGGRKLAVRTPDLSQLRAGCAPAADGADIVLATTSGREMTFHVPCRDWAQAAVQHIHAHGSSSEPSEEAGAPCQSRFRRWSLTAICLLAVANLAIGANVAGRFVERVLFLQHFVVRHVDTWSHGHPDAMYAACGRALRIRPADPVVRTFRGIAAADLWHTSEAISVLERVDNQLQGVGRTGVIARDTLNGLLVEQGAVDALRRQTRRPPGMSDTVYEELLQAEAAFMRVRHQPTPAALARVERRIDDVLRRMPDCASARLLRRNLRTLH